MRRALIISVMLIMLFTGTVYADLPTTFEDFLLSLDDNASDLLKDEMEMMSSEIERLIPEIEELEVDYKEQEETAVSTLQFYQSIGLDTIIELTLEADHLVDVLANVRMIEKKLDDDMATLEHFHNNYMLRKTAKESLERHQEELVMIKRNLEAREVFFKEYGDLTADEMIEVIRTSWEGGVATAVENAMQADSVILNENLNDLLVESSTNTFLLNDTDLNTKTELSYFIDPSHVYVHFNEDQNDGILLGVMTRDEDQKYSLMFEGGFINGIYIPLEWIYHWEGLSMDLANFRPSDKFYVEHRNNAFLIQMDN